MGNTLCKPAINITDVILDEKIKDEPLLTEEAIKELILPKVIEEEVLPKEEEVLPKEEEVLPKDEEVLPKEEEVLPKIISKNIVETIITEICLHDIQRTEVITYEPVVLGDVTKDEQTSVNQTDEMSSNSSQDDPPLKKKRGRPKKVEV